MKIFEVDLTMILNSFTCGKNLPARTFWPVHCWFIQRRKIVKKRFLLKEYSCVENETSGSKISKCTFKWKCLADFAYQVEPLSSATIRIWGCKIESTNKYTLILLVVYATCKSLLSKTEGENNNEISKLMSFTYRNCGLNITLRNLVLYAKSTIREGTKM